MRRTVGFSFVIAMAMLASLSGGEAVARDDHMVVVTDDGNVRPARMHWNIVIHERSDDVSGANGTVRIFYLDTNEQQSWRVTGAGGRLPGASDADRQAFLRLLLTPVGPARAFEETIATVSFFQPAASEGVRRVKVQFSWYIDGAGSVSTNGDIVIKGKKILQN